MDAERILEGWKQRWLTWPDVWEDHPWGDTVFKVGKKIFVFVGDNTDEIAVGMRPADEDLDEALATDGVERSAYIGRYGWVSVHTSDPDLVPLVEGWIAASYDRAGGKTRARTRAAMETGDAAGE